MEAARNSAFEQIERKKYYFSFQGGGNKIYKTALIFGGRSEILIDFQEAPNWRLEWDSNRGARAVKITSSDDARTSSDDARGESGGKEGGE
jgi:hypothetical protein